MTDSEAKAAVDECRRRLGGKPMRGYFVRAEGAPFIVIFHDNAVERKRVYFAVGTKEDAERCLKIGETK